MGSATFDSEYEAYPPQSSLEVLELALLDDQMTVIIQIFYNVIMSVFIILEDDSLNGGIALDEDPCYELANVTAATEIWFSSNLSRLEASCNGEVSSKMNKTIASGNCRMFLI
jgi:hypothetical protein